MTRLPRYADMSEEQKGVWDGLYWLVVECGNKAGEESAVHEEEVKARMERESAADSDMFVAVSVSGWSLMHWTALRARTDALVRCVWECSGERALQAMRQVDSVGTSVLYCLACNPNMTRGMYAVLVEHCTDDDLRAADNRGWTLLFRMAFTYIRDAKTQLQEENVESAMCAVVQRLGPEVLDTETSKDCIVSDDDDDDEERNFPAGSTPRSILRDAGDKGRALLQRLEAAAAHTEAAEEEAKASVGTAPARMTRTTPIIGSAQPLDPSFSATVATEAAAAAAAAGEGKFECPDEDLS